MGKNSKLNINNKQETLVNVKIRNNTEKTGFFEKIVKRDDKIAKPENR
jgi:hypothetical protein